MLSHRERILNVIKGEMADKISFAPRIDVWHNVNLIAGTLPEKYAGCDPDDIILAEGWALNKTVPEFLSPRKPEDNLHRAIGLMRLKEFLFDFSFPPDVDIKVAHEGPSTRIEYHSPIGMINTETVFTKEMKAAGSVISWVKEPPVKNDEDYRVLAYIFGNMKFEPYYEEFDKWKSKIGDDGIALGQSLGMACSSPMNFIQKMWVKATDFQKHYAAQSKPMHQAVEALEYCYDQILPILADSPADLIAMGANYDENITYPAYFKKDIMPWVQKASEMFHAKRKLVYLHTDGENQKLMDLIANTGADVAEAVTPYPMFKMTIGEYYDQWCKSDKITIWGGIPEELLLEEATTDQEMEGFLDELFKVVAPGKRYIAAPADCMPPAGKFERLVRIGEKVEKEGRLPLTAGAARPLSRDTIERAAERVSTAVLAEEKFKLIHEVIEKGYHQQVKNEIAKLLDKGFKPQDILTKGVQAAVKSIGNNFNGGALSKSKVQLSLKAIESALQVLETYLESDKGDHESTIVINTINNVLKDIGKGL
jgi:hypothetical protein